MGIPGHALKNNSLPGAHAADGEGGESGAHALPFHLTDELGNELVRDAVFLDMLDESCAYNRAVGMGASVVEAGLVFDTEANHPLIAQAESRDAVEVA